MPRIEGATRYEQIKAAVDDFMDYHNNEYYMWNLAYLSPNEYYDFVTTGVYPLDIPNPPAPPVIEKSPEELGEKISDADPSADDTGN